VHEGKVVAVMTVHLRTKWVRFVVFCARFAFSQTARTVNVAPSGNNGPPNSNNFDIPGERTALLKDSMSNVLRMQATVTVPLTGANSNGSTSPTGDAEEFAPAGSNNAYGNSSKPYGEVVFSNLIQNVAHTFTFCASRVGVSDVRTALYTVTGANSGLTTLDAANNSTQVATVADIYPRPGGTVTLRIEEGAPNTPRLYYISAMKITYTELAATNGGFADLEPGNNTSQVAVIPAIRPKPDGTIGLSITADPNNTSPEKFHHINALMIEAKRSGLMISVR
jgi:hypothetical protein